MDKISHQALYSRRADPMRLGDALDIDYDLNPQFTRWEKFKSPEAKGLVRAHDKKSRILVWNPIGYRRMLLFFIKNFAEVKRIRLQAAKMTRKWEYFKEDSYLEVA